MKSSQLRILIVAIVGAATSIVAVAHFVLTVMNNRLPWHRGVRDFYLAVGRSYTEGFAIGFFFCFSLTVAATALAGMLKNRRERPATDTSREPDGAKPRYAQNAHSAPSR